MDKNLRHRLTDAFAQARMAALHVDLQTGFYGPATAVAFTRAEEFSQQMRGLGIPNYWVMYTDRWHAGTARTLSVPSSYLDRIHFFHDSISVLPEEIVFEKMDQGLFARNPQPELVFRLAGIDTLLITGVRHNGCVSDTAAGAAINGFDTYVVVDATDRHMSDFDSYEAYLKSGLKEAAQARLHVITAHDVLEILPTPAPLRRVLPGLERTYG